MTIQLSAQIPDVDSLRFAKIDSCINELTKTDKAYLNEIDVSVGKTSLMELLRNIAKVGQVNISVKGVENVSITCNFSRTKISDLLTFICREYGLNIEILGNIISLYPVTIPPPAIRTPQVEYHLKDTTISYDLSNDKLIDVIKVITKQTKLNIVAPQLLHNIPISGYVKGMQLDEAIYNLAEINGLEAQRNKVGIWSFNQSNAVQSGSAPMTVQTYSRPRQFAANQLMIDSLGLVTAQIGRGNVSDIIVDLCQQMKLNYFFISPLNQQAGIYVKSIPLETLFSLLLTGTSYTYYCENGVYVFGNQTKDGGVQSTKIIPLRYRSVNMVEELIPTAIKTGLQIKQFSDLNSMIVSGDQRQLLRVESFLSSIDKSVPLVTIEVIIVDVAKNNIQEAGINLGLGTPPKQTSATLSPGINVNLNASSINNLINSFNGFGLINLGKVSSDFYLSLKFLEENGTIEMRSTPKLSTLNGHEATLKSGETRYYKEVLNNIIGTQNPIQSESFTWKSIEANLNIKILPFVSSDKQITLDIEIDQTEFTAREEKNAPPGTSTRGFKSQIKVSNEDMVLLGGIERNTRDKSSRGLPYVSRVPVLKWLFGSTKNNKTEHKLNIFIRLTVID